MTAELHVGAIVRVRPLQAIGQITAVSGGRLKRWPYLVRVPGYEGKGGTVSDFAAIYEQEYGRVFAYLLLHSENWHVAEDLTSEVFLAALEQYGEWEDRDIPYSHYLRRIAHYQHGNHWRKERRHKTGYFYADQEDRDGALLSDGGIDAVLDRIDSAVAYAFLEAALRKLRPRPLQAIVLRYGLGLPKAEAARRMGCSFEAFHSCQRAALERLQQILLGKEPTWTAKNATRRATKRRS